MDKKALAQTPLVTEFCRVERLYTGGALLDRWQGIAPEKDGALSEEFLVSTSHYIGPGNPPENGISRVRLPDGSLANLHTLINMDLSAFLGEAYINNTAGQAGVLVRVGDSAIRLIIQCHPTAEKAKQVLNIPFGKAEAWYIADTREINGEKPHLYCGFKPGMTKNKWKDLLMRQDVPAMLESMYRFAAQKGDCVLVPAGMPHAMGPGCLFIEAHEPCDYTLRMEKHYAARALSDEEMHYGLGFDTLLDFFEYDTHTPEEIRKRCIMRPALEKETESGKLYQLISYENTDRFAMQLLRLTETFSLPDRDSHYVLITVRNSLHLAWRGGETNVPQGRGVFVPAGVRGLQVTGNADLLLAYPFQT